MTSQIITEHNPGENTTLESSWPVLYMSSATIFIVNFSISLDTNGELCVTSYHFQKGVLPKATPHGNSKSNKPFHLTWSSAME